jgi:hypothetical protein
MLYLGKPVEKCFELSAHMTKMPINLKTRKIAHNLVKPFLKIENSLQNQYENSGNGGQVGRTRISSCGI